MKTPHLAPPVYQTGSFPLFLCKQMCIRARPLELYSKDSRLLGPHHNKAWVPEKALDVHRFLMAAGSLRGHAPGPLSCAPAQGAEVQIPAPTPAWGAPLPWWEWTIRWPYASHCHWDIWKVLAGSSQPLSGRVRVSTLGSTRSSQRQMLGAPGSS